MKYFNGSSHEAKTKKASTENWFVKIASHEQPEKKNNSSIGHNSNGRSNGQRTDL